MIGIKEVASYYAPDRVSNYERMEKFGINESFIEKKIGIKNVRVTDKNISASDMCVLAYENLEKKIKLDRSTVECLIVITQNPDYNIPHTSAIVHGKLDMPESCACFDISLGCSGFVYGASVIKSFMEENGFRTGLLFTSDQYSRVIDPEDKNTSLLFGDAAAVTLFTDDPVYTLGKMSFGTIGKKYENLICRDGVLFMDGFEIFNFASGYVPVDFEKSLAANGITKDDIDCFMFHQGSKYIVDTLRKKLGLPQEKVVFDIEDYGNTVSSSIPVLLEKVMNNEEIKKIYISGFGVGLSWASGVLNRV
ncbi:ketoacyl-ACP synthase III [Seleniivibrio woodruffii]|uniref:3-oxoacyl-[acyl-carrier-protein] synthase-3 n=1 Tax=Seleniivibrio woodruffii TaxID=1078050 RepID=A0A4R1KC87_9BACT|nr:ketoacyl-ACP synthase III [Seleniivibrio woodruffii]TCK62135.1 3-oxoacyl-[acyl-carrier-protein] synthase-3 [Seleniivibrio woodruffii]TVZ34748.1 3-oxoacyl-[acyl-carrier-protein] synthase-3 [Seleniivibrio woodruffii]